MGTVYRATHIQMENTVAVKILHPHLASDQYAVERFRREARSAAQIRHPNAVAVTDFGVSREPGIAYLVMEFLEGESLRDKIKRRRRLGLEEAFLILSQTCLGVSAAHARNIIHRDLKPDNIWLIKVENEIEHVKVLDFGIAKLQVSTDSMNLTQQGTIVGTPSYMSPEQSRGEELDAGSDIYSLGVIVYEMLTGRVPFEGETAMAVVLMHNIERPRPLRELRPEIPAEVEKVVLRALEKKRDDRPESALGLAQEMEAALNAAGVQLKSLGKDTPRSVLALNSYPPEPARRGDSKPIGSGTTASDSSELDSERAARSNDPTLVIRDVDSHHAAAMATARQQSAVGQQGGARSYSANETESANIQAAAQSSPLSTLEIAHVLSAEIVDYPNLAMDQQSRHLGRLLRIISQTPEFSRAQAGDRLIGLPTADGMTLVFFGDPVQPVRCATEIARALQGHPELKLRIGLHSGPVYRMAGIDARENVAGEGIKTAQRIARCGDAGHIIASRPVADTLSHLVNWRKSIYDLGEREITPGARLQLFNLYTGEVGNPERPCDFPATLPSTIATTRAQKGIEKTAFKYRTKSKLALAAAVMIVAAVAALAILSSLILTTRPFIVVHASDLQNQPIEAVQLGTKGVSSTSPPTDSAGNTRLTFHQRIKPNAEVFLIVMPQTPSPLTIISPWRGQVKVRPLDTDAADFEEVVLIPLGEKTALQSDLVRRALASRVIAASAPKTPSEKPPAARQQAALSKTAQEYGFSQDDIVKAILALAQSKDPLEKGLAAQYQRDYPEAKRILEELLKQLEQGASLGGPRVPLAAFFLGAAQLGGHLSQQQQASITDAAFFLGQALFEEAEYTEAAEAYRKAIAIRPNDSDILNSLGLALYEAGDYSACEEVFKQSLDIRQNELGPDHLDVALSLNNLAEVYRKQARYSDAELLHQRSLEIRRNSEATDPLDVSQSLNNLAVLYYDQGKYKESQPLYEQSLKIFEEHLQKNDPYLAVSFNNLALLYQTLGKYSEAEPLYERSLRIIEQLPEAGASDVATWLNLGKLYSDEAKYDKAEALYERAQKLLNEDFHPNQDKLASTLDYLGGLYLRQGRYAEARQHLTEAFEIRNKRRASDLPDIADSLFNIGTLDRIEGKYPDAELRLNQAREIWEKNFGTDDSRVALGLNGLAKLYFRQGRFSEAEPLYERSRQIWETTRGSEHPYLTGFINNLAELRRAQARYEEAEQLCTQSLALSEKAFGPDHPDVAESLRGLAEAYSGLGRYAEAEQLFKRALRIVEKKLGPKHPSAALTFNDLGLLYSRQGEYRRAEVMYERARSLFETAFGSSHPDVAMVRDNMAGLRRLRSEVQRKHVSNITG